ncbi:MAG: aminoglycoside 3-N-acetyltransferase [Bradyrhizobium sp.]|nr:aminoglycoside 3-N-acetyltransferase [Bradyrhizobium sp.]
MISPRRIAISFLRKVIGKDDVRSYLRTKQLALKKRLYRTTISEAELRDAFVKLGVTRGRTVWVQSSWNEFYNFPGKPSTVIDLLREMIGPEGTLVMPAIPLAFVKFCAAHARASTVAKPGAALEMAPGQVLQIDREPASTGLICEVFRRYPGVVRSIHFSSSVIACGPQAEFLVKDHHKTETPWDPDSPFQRLMQVDALFIGMGVGRFLANLTPLHAVESILRHEIPFFANIFQGTTTYRWSKGGQQGEHSFRTRQGTFDGARLGRHYPKEQYVELRLSNLWLWSISARNAINTGVALGREGITMFNVSLLDRLRDLRKKRRIYEDLGSKFGS